jgi:oligopeptidase B
MKRFLFALSIIAVLLLAACSGVKVTPPVAEKNPFTVFDNRTDNFYWMRLSDEQKNDSVSDDQTKKVLSYLESENLYTKTVMKHTEQFQKVLYDELVGRLKQNDQSVPYFDNGYYYYSRFEEGSQYPVYCRKKGNLEATEEIMLDVNSLAAGKSYCSVTGLTVSDDNKLLAYATDFVSRRQYTLNILNLETKETLSDRVENISGNIVWAGDNKTVVYTTKDPVTLRSYKVFSHFLGTPPEKDREVFWEKDETYSVYVGLTKSKKYIALVSDQTLASEVRLIESVKPESEPVIFEPRKINHEYQVDHIGNTFYIRTNINGSENFKLMVCSGKDFSSASWTDFIPHRKDILLENFELFNDYLVAEERINGLSALRIINMNDKTDHYLDFGQETYTCGIGANPSADSRTLRYTFSSLTTPASVFDYNMDTREKKLMKQDEVLGGFSSDNYQSERIWARAADSTLVPVSLVYRKGFNKDGKAPLLLYAYGSYGISSEPGFRSSIISLLDRGFVYAIAHVRGGSEMGRYWYENGKLLKKINTFTDFNTCAEHLVNQNYTSTDRLFALGGSAGGLLMGAILNLRPDLYKGVIAAVPFVDVVTTMLDSSIPLTTAEWDEWGNPSKKEYYDYMLSYSPYDRVEAKDYPNILVTTGYWDSQVQYWEPAKWVAKLRDMKTDENLLLMDCNMTAGHGGASGRFEQFRIVALQYAFMLDLAGIEK